MGKWTDEAIKIRKAIDAVKPTLTDEQASKAVSLFAHWKPGWQYNTDYRVQYNDLLYKCLTEHVSQETWTPDMSPSLWVRISDPAIEWPEWVQPLGSTDAYLLGDKVTHSEKHWISEYNNNVWEPGVYGWVEVTD